MVKLTTCYFCDYGSYYGNKDETTSYPIYEIPEAWRYIKFASLVNFRIGKTPPRSEATFWGTEIPWVSISDMPISGYVTNTRESISNHEEMKRIISKVDLLFQKVSQLFE